MSKLIKLKKWLTVPETAKHLSQILSEPVGDADVLRLALDGHLNLSLRLSSQTPAKPYFKIKTDALERNFVASIIGDGQIALPKGGPIWQPEGLDDLGPGECLQLRADILTYLDTDVWDLPMIDAARLCVEHQYQELIGGAPITDVSLEGLVVRSLSGSYFQLQEHLSDNPHSEAPLSEPYGHCSNYYPAFRLPHDDYTALVVRTRHLTEFVRTIEDAGKQPTEKGVEKPLTTRQRRTLLSIIAALCDYSAIKPNERGAAGQIAAMTDEIGASITAETIAGLLKEIPEALETRMK